MVNGPEQALPAKKLGNTSGQLKKNLIAFGYSD
jgi:hypothetical protein